MDSIKMTTETQLPQGWEIKRLGDVATSEKGKKPKNQSNEKTDEFCYPYVDIEAFEKGVIKSYTDGVKCVLCDENDFLMVWDGSRSGLVGKGIKGALGSTLVRISLPNVKNLYAYYFLLSKYKEINTRAKGSGTPHVDPDLLWNYAFPIPSLEETQTAIVNKIESLFAEIDAGIASLKTAQQQLKHYRQSLLKNAFNGELTKQWRLEQADRLPSATELLAQIQTAREQHHAEQLADWQTAVKQWEQTGKQGKKPSKPKAPTQAVKFEENFADLPNGWGVVRLEELSKKITDGEHFKPPVQEEGIYFLSAKDVKENGISLDDPLFIDQTTAEKARHRCDPEKGDILIVSRGATVGRMCLVDINETFCLLGSVILIKPLNSINNAYLNFAMKSPKINQEMIGVSGSTAQQAIYLRDIKNINIPICSLAEQTQIVAILESKLTACDQLASELTTQLKQAELLKQAVLKAAFEGKLIRDNHNE